MPSAVSKETVAAKNAAGSKKPKASVAGAADSAGSKAKPNKLTKKRNPKGIEGGGQGGAEEEDEEGESDEGPEDEVRDSINGEVLSLVLTHVLQVIEQDDKPLELGEMKWAVRFYTSTAPSKKTALIDDEGRGPRLKEIFVTKAHSCRFLSRNNDWRLRLYTFEDGAPYFDDETAPPLTVVGNQASTEGWKAYEVVRAEAPQKAPAREKAELDEEELAELKDAVRDFKRLAKKGEMTLLDLGDEATMAELKKAVRAGLLSAAELKAAEDKFKKENKAQEQPVASTSGTRHDDDDTASAKSKKSAKKDDGDDGSSIKSKKPSKGT